MQDPQFSTDLAKKLKQQESPVPPPPRMLKKYKAPDSFTQALFRSLVLHAFLIVSALLYNFAAKRWGLGDSQALKAFQDVKNAIRVDVVDLPRLKASELQAVDLTQDVAKDSAPSETEKTPEPSPTAMVDKTVEQNSEKAKEEAAKKNEKTAAQKLKEIKDRLTADQKRKEEIAKLLKKKNQGSGGRPELAGNIKSEGFSTTGEVATAADAYVGKARAHLHKNWKVPAWVSSSSHSARIVVKLAPSGKVVFKKLTKSSQNKDFDDSVTRAVENADPFPEAPEALRLQLLQVGIEFGFPK